MREKQAEHWLTLTLLVACLLTGEASSAEADASAGDSQTSKQAWGKPVRGVQMGFRIFDVCRGNDAWTPRCVYGDQFILQYQFRNASKKQLEFDEQLPSLVSLVVFDAKGNETVVAPYYSGPGSQKSWVLQPGQATQMREVTLTVGPLQGGGMECGASRRRANLDPGRYRFALRYKLPTMIKPLRKEEVTSGAIPLEVSDSPVEQTKGAISLLSRHLDSFALRLSHSTGKGMPFVLLHVVDGVQGDKYPAYCTVIRISKEQAKSVIDYLSKADFFPHALDLGSETREENRRIKRVPHYMMAAICGNNAPKQAPLVNMTAPQTTESVCQHLGKLGPLLDPPSAARLRAVVEEIERRHR